LLSSRQPLSLQQKEAEADMTLSRTQSENPGHHLPVPALSGKHDSRYQQRQLRAFLATSSLPARAVNLHQGPVQMTYDQASPPGIYRTQVTFLNAYAVASGFNYRKFMVANAY